jgi:WD40 repeat protein
LRKSSETFSLLGKSGYAFNGLLLLRPGLLISAASNQISSWDLETKSIQDECYIFGNKHMERISDTMFATLGATSATIQLWNDKLQKTGSKIFPYSNILQSVSYIGNNRLLVGIANSEAILWNFEHKNTEKLDETLPHWSVRKVSNCIVAADKNSISILKMESLRKLKMINDACTDGETVIQVAELENKIVYMNKEHNLVLVDLEGRVLQTYKGCSNIATRITTI